MKVICDAPGQTCNRLWSYVATLSECIVKKQKMVILFFDYTVEDFPYFRSSPYIFLPFYYKRLLKVGKNWGRFKHLTWKLTHNDTWDKIFMSLGFIKGWHTRRDTKYISEAKNELKKIFTPCESIVQQAQCLLTEMYKQADIVVGVHIRRGDYAAWNDGQFYYELSDYYSFMCDVKRLYPNQKVVFFISSNENVDTSIFSDCICFRHSVDSSVILDLYSLSLCDKIMGPFSTFSRWASFIGEKPICFLETKNQIINDNSFSTVLDFFHLVDGREIEDW